MGNGAGKIGQCLAGGDMSCRHGIEIEMEQEHVVIVDEGLGHSFCYIPRSDDLKTSTTIPTISGASVSANNFTHLSTELSFSGGFLRAASFESSTLFSAIPLQPVPRRASGGFLSGPIERASISGPIDDANTLSTSSSSDHHDPHKTIDTDKNKKQKKKKKRRLSLKELVKRVVLSRTKKSNNIHVKCADSDKKISTVVRHNNKTNNSISVVTATTNTSSSDSMMIASNDDHDDDEEEEEEGDYENVEWAQGKAGEDRVHMVISEEQGWVFAGIYDGFNGPDAPDYLLSNLFSAVHKELRGLLWTEKETTTTTSTTRSGMSFRMVRADDKIPRLSSSWDVLRAMSRALKSTEDGFNAMVGENNPELALMGSCVLVMLIKGDDVYLMSVGDSRALLAQKPHPINNDDEDNDNDDCCDFHFSNLIPLQLTLDHSTLVEEEVERIRKEHPDDASAVINDRVKGYLKVTRAFGAGFLKQPKWNNALLEMFRIDYVGTKPYVTCEPWLHHHKLTKRDTFIILSSDGLYQYFTNDQAISEVHLFIASFPDGDPAQHLLEQVLFRAATKAGMDFHELLDIPQGERRRYHDDISIIVISLEGRIWRSSV